MTSKIYSIKHMNYTVSYGVDYVKFTMPITHLNNTVFSILLP